MPSLILAVLFILAGSNFLIYAIAAIIILIFLGGISLIAGNIIPIYSAKANVTDSSASGGAKAIFGPKVPDYINGDAYHVLNKGHDILLEGEAEKVLKSVPIKRYAIQPTNFVGISPIPKMMVQIGESVKAGDPILFDKKRPDIIHTAPVSGEVIELNRGPKRAIAEVVILADKEQRYKKFDIPDLAESNRDDIIKLLLESGYWPSITERPYGIIADPNMIPRDIFISTFDTAPSGPDYDFIVSGREQEFQEGIDVLSKLTEGSVYLGLRASFEQLPSDTFRYAQNVEKHWFKGKHPSGNVGVQIHHIKPLNPGETVWTLKVQDVITLGQLFLSSCYFPEKVVALTGAELSHNHYVRTISGANISELLAEHQLSSRLRIVSGNVLSGSSKQSDSFINSKDDQISVLAEGDYYETFGWMMPSTARPSASKTYPHVGFSDLAYKADTNTHGEKRAFVMSGQYERVLPMDIYLQFLMKDILNEDIERMEGLGIHELLEEDIALCEFACTSKQPLQKILRDGLNLMQEQG